MNEEMTVASILQNLCDLSQATEIKDSETGKEISRMDYQDLVFQKVDLLAGVLGIDLEG